MRAATVDSVSERERHVELLLSQLGLGGVRVSAIGHEREIAALTVPPSHFERLLGEEGARLSARLRALGFRYVALDLATAPEDLSAGGAAP